MSVRRDLPLIPGPSPPQVKASNTRFHLWGRRVPERSVSEHTEGRNRVLIRAGGCIDQREFAESLHCSLREIRDENLENCAEAGNLRRSHHRSGEAICFLTSICPTDRSLEIHEVASDEVTSRSCLSSELKAVHQTPRESGEDNAYGQQILTLPISQQGCAAARAGWQWPSQKNTSRRMR